MSIFKYLTLSHLQKVLAALDVRFLGINNEINEIKEDIDKVETELGKIDIKQSDWEMIDYTNDSYILNKPAIKTGAGENSIIVGEHELDESATMYIIYVTGAANATTYSYTTEDTIEVIGRTAYVVEYDNKYFTFSSIDKENNQISFFKTLSSTALSNAEVKLYYHYKEAMGNNSVAEGSLSWSAGNNSHAEGSSSAMGSFSHAEGMANFAQGQGSHVEGGSTVAINNFAHAEGTLTKAIGAYTHAEGFGSAANGGGSHAEGQQTIASGGYQHVQGKYNIEDTNGTYAHIVGNGTSSARSNAHTLDWNGNGWYAGKLTVGTAPANNMDVATKKYVDDATTGITTNLSGLTDTTISSPVDGQLLKYNATTSKWENVTLSLAINNGVIQLKEGNTVISSVTLPIYNGGVSS